MTFPAIWKGEAHERKIQIFRIDRGIISTYVFNNYEWSERLDAEVDRITLEYRKKDKIGRDKASVKHYLYKALAMGLWGFESLISYKSSQ